MAGNNTPEKKDAPKGASRTKKPLTGAEAQPEEIGGRDGPEPTRYGDWEVKGICSDF